MRLSELLLREEYSSAFSAEDIHISHITCNINEVKAGTLFICIKGQKVDTHSLFSALCTLGVTAVIAEEGSELPHTDTPVFYVSSTRRAMACIWNRFVGEPTRYLHFIGITGTNGKTSTAYLLDTILREGGYHTAMVGTLGMYIDGVREGLTDDTRTYTMTTPDPDLLYPFLAKAKLAGVTHVVMEVSSHAISHEKIAPITFTEALFTNLSPEHLDFHHTMDAYADTKKRLFSQCEHATINCDDTCGAAIAVTADCPVTKCGILWQADAVGSQIIADENERYTYFYRYGNIRQLVQLSVAGSYQVYNSLLALTSSIHLGVSAGTACRALGGVTFIPGRLQEVSTDEDDIHVYIDFAHTDAALRSLLSDLRKTTQNRLVVVFGCGGERDTLKRPLMGACAMEHADYTIITSDNCRGEDVTSIIKDILVGHTDPVRRRVIPDREAAIRHAILTAKKNDTIVLAGKGHENYEIKRDGIHPFNEMSIAHHALEKRRMGHTTSNAEV